MPFGTAVITLTHYVKTGTPDALGEYEKIPVKTDAPGCRHRPLAFKEVVELNLDIASEYWRTTIPTGEYDPDLLAALAGLNALDVVAINGQDYQIIGGVRPFDDMEGEPFKATIISQKQIG